MLRLRLIDANKIKTMYDSVGFVDFRIRGVSQNWGKGERRRVAGNSRERRVSREHKGKRRKEKEDGETNHRSEHRFRSKVE